MIDVEIFSLAQLIRPVAIKLKRAVPLFERNFLPTGTANIHEGYKF